jgi:hypothetical protein
VSQLHLTFSFISCFLREVLAGLCSLRRFSRGFTIEMLAGSTLKVIERERLEEVRETEGRFLEEAAMKAVGNATGYEVASWVEKEGEDLTVVIEGDRVKNRG